jgi:tetratricopeptide (TPR) repeat protein
MTDPLAEAERLMARRDWPRAHALCMAALERDPRDARAFFLLGVLTDAHGNTAKAAELFARAAALDPSRARHHASLARCLTAMSRPAEARAAAERAAALDPPDALTLDTIGVVFSRTGLHERATPFFRRAVALSPGVADYQQNLATALQFEGDFDGARAAFRRAVALDPGLHRAWWSLGEIAEPFSANDRVRLEALFPAPGEDDADRALHVGHTLARLDEAAGRHPDALDWLNRAKAVRRRGLDYDPARDAALFAAAAATAGPSAPDASDAAPIFIVGLPRTGTTLVDRILSSHPDAVSVGERTDFARVIKLAAGTPSRLMLDGETLAAAAGALDLAAAGRAYLAAVAPLAAGGRSIDKMPLNVLYAGLILRALPNARIVCLRRHPMDAALSNYRQLFATQFPYYDYAFSLKDTARYVAGFERLADHWRAVLPPDRYTEIGYEALVADQEGETRRLLGHCGLSWDPACLAFHENAAPVATPSALQVRQPIHAGSIGRWRRYGDGLDPMLRVFREAGVEV